MLVILMLRGVEVQKWAVFGEIMFIPSFMKTPIAGLNMVAKTKFLFT
jgi:hypothetical protein